MDSKFALTIDVEEWFQVENLRGAFPLKKWDDAPSRLSGSMDKLLQTLADEGVDQATFFILGWIAKRHADLVRQIGDLGFEIASHGMDHQINANRRPEEIRADLAGSRKLLEDIAAREVIGYRAPSFTIDGGVIETLRECGYRYDSSFNDVAWHDRYGRLDLSAYTPGANGIWTHPSGSFFEIPISNLRLWGRVIPWGGGGYFRLIPPMLHRPGVMRVLRQSGVFIFYMHPWEIDPDQPRVENLSRLASFRHYNNLGKTLPRLRLLLRELKSSGVEFVQLRDLISAR